MSNAPTFHIDIARFNADPYPDLAKMRANTPICYVPELDATLFTKRDDIFTHEKRVEVFSSVQPDGLMVQLMGENMMRKDGAAHAAERKATFPAFSPRTVRDHWADQFRATVDTILRSLAPKGRADLVTDFALQVSGEALRIVTGLSNMSAQDMDRTSQAMIDGIANYQKDPQIEAYCRECTSMIDARIDAMITLLTKNPNLSLLSVQLQSDLPMPSVRANVKLAISGGQNEPRDAIAGTAWAILTHSAQRTQIETGVATFRDAFAEYARWISPIGMSPRRITKIDTIRDVTLETNDQVFFMYGSANRDESIFENPDTYDIRRDFSSSLAFGAGPHFCAGAATARTLIADIALPMLFERLPNLRLTGPTSFSGWAFRGPTSVLVAWDT